jgi:hypothetical protein
MATEAKKKNSKNGKKPVDAAEMKKLEEAAKPLAIGKSTRDLVQLLAERVTVLPNHIGVKIQEDTPIEEWLRIYDWAEGVHMHAGFIIGDVINFADAKWGDKYTQAMAQTGRAYDTLKHYAMTARRIPFEKRIPALSFSHHREALQIGDDSKIEKVLVDAGKQAEKGKFTALDFREKINTLKPKKKPRKPTSGKHTKKGGKKEAEIPYEPTDAEVERLQEAEIAVTEAAKLVSKLFPLVGRLTNKEKRRWTKLTEPFITFYNAVDRITSAYTD